jgi:HAD superfamily hydrolase (TIGR01509 family)
VTPAHDAVSEQDVMRRLALLFDMDGTLINSREDIVLSIQHGFIAINQAPPDPDTIILNVGKPLVDFPRLLGYDLTEPQRSDFARAYRAYYAAHCADHTDVFPGVCEALQRFRDAGYKTAVVTTKSQEQAEGTLRAIGLSRYFDYVRGWAEGRKLKPDPEPLIETIRVFGVRPEQALMIGDSEQDILAAQAAGIECCACLYGFRKPDFLLALKPTYSIRSFPELLPIVLGTAMHAATE